MNYCTSLPTADVSPLFLELAQKSAELAQKSTNKSIDFFTNYIAYTEIVELFDICKELALINCEDITKFFDILAKKCERTTHSFLRLLAYGEQPVARGSIIAAGFKKKDITLAEWLDFLEYSLISKAQTKEQLEKVQEYIGTSSGILKQPDDIDEWVKSQI